MLKKLACTILAVHGFNVYAGAVVESFDWGPGVPGRESFTAGSPIHGVRAQVGDVFFLDTSSDRCVFSSEGGRGALLMKGLNNSVGFSCPISGITTVKATGKFLPGNRPMCGFWIGVQSAAPDNPLLNGQSTDRLAVQLNPAGAVVFRSVVGGVTNQAAAGDGLLRFSPGDLVKMELTINLSGKTASIKVTGAGEGNVRVRTVEWTSDKTPDWGMIMINQTGNGQLLLDSVEVRTDPLILG